MRKTRKTTHSPFCLRLSFEERARLEREAMGLSMSEYVRQRVFDESVPKRRMRGKTPVKDHQVLSQLLGELGRSRIPNNLNQLAKAANNGTFDLCPETKNVILESCSDIREIRNDLIKALGLKE